jgi:hypothetical protein
VTPRPVALAPARVARRGPGRAVITLDVTSFYASGAGGIRSYYQAKARWCRRSASSHFAVPARAGVERLGGGWLRVPGPPLGAHYRAFGDVAALWRSTTSRRRDRLGSYHLPQLLAPALRRRPGGGRLLPRRFPDDVRGARAPAARAGPRCRRRGVVAGARPHRRHATLTGSRDDPRAGRARRAAGVLGRPRRRSRSLRR